MKHNDIAEQLAAAMKQDGYELDGCDRLIIRQTLSRTLIAQRRRADLDRSANNTFIWSKPRNPRD